MILSITDSFCIVHVKLTRCFQYELSHPAGDHKCQHCALNSTCITIKYYMTIAMHNDKSYVPMADKYKMVRSLDVITSPDRIKTEEA